MNRTLTRLLAGSLVGMAASTILMLRRRNRRLRMMRRTPFGNVGRSMSFLYDQVNKMVKTIRTGSRLLGRRLLE